MPEYVVATAIAATLSMFGVSFRKIDAADRRMDALELKVAEKYVTKEEFRAQFTELFRVLARLEDKIDAHVSEEQNRIAYMKKKYHLDEWE
tara:strand:+ start:9586 stop:9858 length:273 start_codon:yes stop_codon:yes gene_type:complete